MDIDPRRLPFLLSVAREGGIVAAADILMVSPSAVSQQIQKLEEEVGLRLVERTTRVMSRVSTRRCAPEALGVHETLRLEASPSCSIVLQSWMRVSVPSASTWVTRSSRPSGTAPLTVAVRVRAVPGVPVHA